MQLLHAFINVRGAFRLAGVGAKCSVIWSAERHSGFRPPWIVSNIEVGYIIKIVID